MSLRFAKATVFSIGTWLARTFRVDFGRLGRLGCVSLRTPNHASGAPSGFRQLPWGRARADCPNIFRCWSMGAAGVRQHRREVDVCPALVSDWKTMAFARPGATIREGTRGRPRPTSVSWVGWAFFGPLRRLPPYVVFGTCLLRPFVLWASLSSSWRLRWQISSSWTAWWK